MQKKIVFTAGTWNMGGGEGPTGPTFEQVKSVVHKMRNESCSIYLFQEGQKDENVEFLKRLGLNVHQHGPECLIAWNDRWVAARTFGQILNPNNPFHRKNNPADVFCKMPRAVLCNKHGQTLDVGSYHLPSSVQERDKPPSRIAATREAMLNFREIADTSRCNGILLGGDDNVDEKAGAWGPWNFMLERATGLRQVSAPRNTLGHRKVDDFRVKRLLPVGRGAVIHGPTDHNAFVQEFAFR